MLRADAARALGTIGTKADLPLLERLAKSGALEREQGGCTNPDQIYYPVRGAATQAIKAIEKRETAKP